MDERRSTTMINKFPNDIFLLDGKNFRISQIVKKWIFGRQTPDGNEKPYLEHAYGTEYYTM